MQRRVALGIACAGLIGCRDASQPLAPALPSTQAAGPPTYQWVPFPRTANTPITFATAINAIDQIVGQASLSPDETCPCHAVLWLAGAMVDLGTLGGANSYPNDIDDGGRVVGWSETAGGTVHAFLWENGAMRDLGSLGGGETRATRVNGVGQIIGSSADAPSFLWQGGVMQALPLRAAAINSAGQIAGWITTTDSALRRAAQWQGGTLTELGTLGGNESWANAINPAGAIVGASRTAAGAVHAVLWNQGRIQDLGVPPGSVSAEAVVVNGRGQVAGIATGADGYPRGFFWENGVMQDIGTLGTQTYVFDMNEQGTIVGWSAQSSASFRHAIVWQRGALVDLGPANAFFSQAVAINPRGVIAGNTASDPSLRQAGMWQPVPGTDSTTLVAGAQNVGGMRIP